MLVMLIILVITLVISFAVLTTPLIALPLLLVKIVCCPLILLHEPYSSPAAFRRPPRLIHGTTVTRPIRELSIGQNPKRWSYSSLASI